MRAVVWLWLAGGTLALGGCRVHDPSSAGASAAIEMSRLTGVSFRTALGGQYIGAVNNGGGAVIATATAAREWETFSLLDVNAGSLVSGDIVFIQVGNGQYLQAWNGGGSTVNAGSDNQLAWEMFKLVKDSGGGTVESGDTVGLQAHGGSWVSAERGGGGRVFAYGGALGAWERLIISIRDVATDAAAGDAAEMDASTGADATAEPDASTNMDAPAGTEVSNGTEVSTSTDAAAGADGGSTSEFTLPYYRLRVEFVDQGDWATLRLADPGKVIKVRQMSVAGKANVLVVDKTEIGLNTNLGSDLTVVADYAIAPGALDAPFPFTIEKGGAGTVTVRVSSVAGATVTLLKEIVRQPRELAFSVDLSSLRGTPPIQAPLAPVRNMATALYYPWYFNYTWSAPALRDHPLTPYESADPAALARHIDQAQSAGITAFFVSWLGPGSWSDNVVKLLLAEAAKKNFKVGFFVETTGGHLPENPQIAVDWLAYIAKEYSDHPAVLKIEGRPVVQPWLTGWIPLDTWKQIRAQVRARGKDVWLVQDVQEFDYLAVFDGVRYSGGIKGLGERVRHYAVMADEPAAKVWIATAMPGFDERLLDDRGPNPRFIDRQNGARFRGDLDDVFANSPQWVNIDTWNEWFENTHIEPSVNYGDQYLQIAGQYFLGWVQP